MLFLGGGGHYPPKGGYHVNMRLNQICGQENTCNQSLFLLKTTAPGSLSIFVFPVVNGAVEKLLSTAGVQ